MGTLRNRIRAICYTLGAGHAWEDIAQDVEFKLWQNPNRPLYWATLDAVRRLPPKTFQLPENLTAPAGDNEGFENLIAGLDPFSRALIVLTYKWDLSPAEVGEVFGISAPNVCNYLAGTLRDLRG